MLHEVNLARKKPCSEQKLQGLPVLVHALQKGREPAPNLRCSAGEETTASAGSPSELGEALGGCSPSLLVLPGCICQAARAVCQQFRSQAWSPRKSFYWRHVLMFFLVSLFFKNNCCVLWMNSVEKSATIVTHLPNTLVFYPTSQRTISFTIKGFGTFQ